MKAPARCVPKVELDFSRFNTKSPPDTPATSDVKAQRVSGCFLHFSRYRFGEKRGCGEQRGTAIKVGSCALAATRMPEHVRYGMRAASAAAFGVVFLVNSSARRRGRRARSRGHRPGVAPHFQLGRGGVRDGSCPGRRRKLPTNTGCAVRAMRCRSTDRAVPKMLRSREIDLRGIVLHLETSRGRFCASTLSS